MKIVGRVRDEGLRRGLADVASRLGAAVVDTSGLSPDGMLEAVRAGANVVVLELEPDVDLSRVRQEAHAAGAALVVACSPEQECGEAVTAQADEWLILPVSSYELEARLRSAMQRSAGGELPPAASADLLRYQELLFDATTGTATLPTTMEQARELLERSGRLTVLYLHFFRFERLEESFGREKLDAVLKTTADALRDFCAMESTGSGSLIAIPFVFDEDFVILTATDRSTHSEPAAWLVKLSRRLEPFVRERIEREHGEQLAALATLYMGISVPEPNPRVRTERLLYRGIREAAKAARSAEHWELASRVADLKRTIRDGAVFIEYHPIIDTHTEEVYGYEALARGVRQELRSPEVLFEVAEEANLVWELSRLLRRRAVQGIIRDLSPDQRLFLNVDPHDFEDPLFRKPDPSAMGIDDPSRVVFEITERVAITDYPRFKEQLDTFRSLGFRFAVDDAGSGYAGLGSIANLAPDYIKLDISLISEIDTNFLKQNLVETLVNFAEGHGAKVVAEGVERSEEFETVRKLGVHLAQGFYFHRSNRVRRSAA